jgi:hypothetical protein
MSRFAPLLSILVSGLLTLACTASRSTLGHSSLAARVYPLEAVQVEGILRRAMEAEFGTGNVHRVARDELAFEAELRERVDADVVTAIARPWKGLGEGGAIVEGYVLEVRRSGTIPSRGIVARDRVFERAVAAAEQITPPLRQAPR